MLIICLESLPVLNNNVKIALKTVNNLINIINNRIKGFTFTPHRNNYNNSGIYKLV